MNSINKEMKSEVIDKIKFLNFDIKGLNTKMREGYYEQNVALRTENEELRMAIVDLEGQNDDFRGKVDRLVLEVEQRDKEIELLSETLKSYFEVSKSSSKGLEELTDNFKRFHTEQNLVSLKLGNKLLRLEKQYKVVMSENIELKQCLKEAVQQLKNSKQNLERYKELNEELEVSLFRSRVRNQGLCERIAKLQDRYEISDLGDQFEVLGQGRSRDGIAAEFYGHESPENGGPCSGGVDGIGLGISRMRTTLGDDSSSFSTVRVRFDDVG